MAKKKEEVVEEVAEKEVPATVSPEDQLALLIEKQLEIPRKSVNEIQATKTFLLALTPEQVSSPNETVTTILSWVKEKMQTRDLHAVGFTLGAPGEMTEEDKRYFDVTDDSIVLTLEHS